VRIGESDEGARRKTIQVKGEQRRHREQSEKRILTKKEGKKEIEYGKGPVQSWETMRTRWDLAIVNLGSRAKHRATPASKPQPSKNKREKRNRLEESWVSS